MKTAFHSGMLITTKLSLSGIRKYRKYDTENKHVYSIRALVDGRYEVNCVKGEHLDIPPFRSIVEAFLFIKLRLGTATDKERTLYYHIIPALRYRFFNYNAMDTNEKLVELTANVSNWIGKQCTYHKDNKGKYAIWTANGDTLIVGYANFSDLSKQSKFFLRGWNMAVNKYVYGE